MPVSLAGFVKNRAHQFGRQSAFKTAVAAKRRYAMKGVPAPDPQWTDPDVDTGSIYVVAAPYRMGGSYPASLTIPVLHYNDLPLIHDAFFGTNASGTGTPAVVWDWNPSATTPANPNGYSYEFFDDTGTTDGFQFRDGILESFEITGEGKGPLSATLNFQFGAFFGQGFTDFPADPVIPTVLAFEPNEAIVYMADLFISLASSPYDLGYTSRIVDALHSFTFRGTTELDRKEFANGDHSFDVDAWGAGCAQPRARGDVGQDHRHHRHRLRDRDAWMSRSLGRSLRRDHGRDGPGQGLRRHRASRTSGTQRSRCATTPGPRATWAATPPSS